MGKQYRTLTSNEWINTSQKAKDVIFENTYPSKYMFNRPFSDKDNEIIEKYISSQSFILLPDIYIIVPSECIKEIEVKKEIVNKIRTYV